MFETFASPASRVHLSISPKRFATRLPSGHIPSSVRGSSWPEALAALLALAAVAGCVLSGYHPRTWQASGSDFKTLYASAQLFRSHLDPYDFHNIETIFHAERVVPPTSWYAHAPVYPPFTLAAISLLTWLPMVPAVFLWLALTTLTVAAAAWSLARAAGGDFHLGRPWRLALIALFAASPLVSFGLEMGNVSPLVGALCIVAVAAPDRSRSALTLASACLALGMLLKPHLVLWVLIALILSRSRADRGLALRAAALVSLIVLGVALWMAAHQQLLPNLVAYRRVVGLELTSGSMASTNRELMAVAAQITSLSSLLGYVLHGRVLSFVTGITLTLLLATLVVVSLRIPADCPGTRLLRLAAWSAFGLIATYHRAHDGVFLLVLVPFLLARVRCNWRDPLSWVFSALAFAMAIGPRWETMGWLASKPGLYHVATFLLYRQSPLAVSLLLLLLLVEAVRLAPARRLALATLRDRRDLAVAA